MRALHHHYLVNDVNVFRVNLTGDELEEVCGNPIRRSRALSVLQMKFTLHALQFQAPASHGALLLLTSRLPPRFFVSIRVGALLCTRTMTYEREEGFLLIALNPTPPSGMEFVVS